MRVELFVRAAGLGLFLAAAGVPSALASDLSTLQGAWLEDSIPCDEIFGKGGSFKRPLNLFASAFVISGNRVRTPLASCGVKSVKSDGSRRILLLNCTTSIAPGEAKAILEKAPDGSLKRFLNEQDTVGTSYKQCRG